MSAPTPADITSPAKRGLLGDPVGLLATATMVVAATVLLGHLYETPIIYGAQSVPLAPTTALFLICLALVVVFTLGPTHLPLRPFVGQSMRAKLLRAFLPVSVLVVIVNSAIYNYLDKSNLGVNHAIIVASAAMIAALTVALVITAVSRSFGREFDQVTEARSFAESAAKRLEQNLLAFTENGPFAVFMKDADGAYVYVNPLFSTFYSHLPGSILGQKADDYVPAETAKSIREADEAVLKRGMRDVREIHIPHVDGQTRHWHCVRFPILGRNGETLIGGIAVDVSEQVRAREAQAQAQRRMAEVYKMAALGEMAGNIAHEINNPLTVIDGRSMQLSQLLARDPLDLDAALAFSDAITKMTQRLAKIVSGLKTLSRPSDRDPFERTPVARIVEETLAVCSPRLQGDSVTLNVGAIPETLDVDCRPVEISQVLLNLVANANDAVRHQAEKWVDLSVTGEDDWVKITVADSGPGIPKNIRDKITSPFFTTKPAGSGTGLGLSISSGLVISHGGTLDLDDSDGRTRFIVRLPRRQRETTT